jgi:hypothetical protein
MKAITGCYETTPTAGMEIETAGNESNTSSYKNMSADHTQQ